MDKKRVAKRLQLTLLFTVIVFIIMLVTMLLAFTVFFILQRYGITQPSGHWWEPILIFSLISLIIGCILSIIFSKKPLEPIRKVIDASKSIASGDYSVRIDLKGSGELKELNDSFNSMAKELGSVEMLRSDFVNNFSHEFKTPIVSIRGFAKMLKRDDLTDEERIEYLDIIISESERLTELATNVLNLTKVEQQTILTEKKRFNVSEQIRLAISMLDGKWASKNISVSLTAPELFITANEDMLKQVWLNLLDNAMKFSDKNGKVEITAQEGETGYIFTFANQGTPIPPEAQIHIFDKFFQGDKSHTKKGNGLGLSIAARIVDLHGGTIKLQKSDQTQTIFIVTIPG